VLSSKSNVLMKRIMKAVKWDMGTFPLLEVRKMKRGKFSACWRPLMGVVAVGALALGVSALAAPRGSDASASRGTTKGATEVTRLVTGDPTQINAVIAGTPAGGSTILAVDPVADKGPAGPLSYPPGTTITAAPAASRCIAPSTNLGDSCTSDSDCVAGGVGSCAAKTGIGQCINATRGGFRMFAEVHVSDWDVNFNGVPLMKAFQVKIDGAGYMDSDSPGDQPNIIAPLIPCPGADPTPCVIATGEAWATCAVVSGSENCEQAYADGGGNRTDSWCAASGGSCFTGTSDVGDQTNFSFRWVEVSNINAGRADHQFTCSAGPRTGQSCNTNPNCGVGGTCGAVPFSSPFYGGSLFMDVPVGAKGRYNINLAADETFAEDGDANRLQILQKNGFCVNIITGKCCTDLGLVTGSCTSNVTEAECETLDPDGLFTAGQDCTVEGTPEDCAECISASDGDPGGLCDDHDACTTESCDVVNGRCIRGNKAGWVTPVQQADSCCDPGSGIIALKDDGNDCTDDGCSGDPTPDPAPNSPKPGNGTPVHPPASTSTVCNDGVPCTTGDTCGGGGAAPDCAAGSCCGIDINSIACGGALPPCPDAAPCLATGFCFCTDTPDLDFVLTDSAKNPVCDGGTRDTLPCGGNNPGCPGGVCNEFAAGGNCYDEGSKVNAFVHKAGSGAPINGGEFLITYDPSCLKLNKNAAGDYQVTPQAPYTEVLYGPVVDENAGTIFIAIGVDPFAGIDGPATAADMLALSFQKLGECNECCLDFDDNNPQHTYLVDDEGQKVGINGVRKCVRDKGALELVTPDNIKTNRDCDGPTAEELWSPPSASFTCGDATVTCRGAHESGLSYNGLTCEGGTRNTLPCTIPAGPSTGCPGGSCVDKVMNGGVFPAGSSSFCCYAEADDPCGATAGCSGPAGDCAPPGGGKPDGCWTVEVNDETSLDVDVQLCPPITHNDPDGVLTRCIKFCLYSKNCVAAPVCFEDDVSFGGLFNFVGKSRGKVKIDGSQQWGCITAQDMLHTLRSCYVFGANDCDEGQLHAQFSGAPEYSDSHCLVGGNLDGWKKDDPTADPSLDVIDILDFGTFVSQFPRCYSDNDTACTTEALNAEPGPNADINGDGCVTTSDYNFVRDNFLKSAKDCCCGPQAASLPPALTEVSVDELRQMGLDDLIVADLNGDSLVNADDMDAFAQGVRPAKSHDRKGGKGLRSGR